MLLPLALTFPILLYAGASWPPNAMGVDPVLGESSQPLQAFSTAHMAVTQQLIWLHNNGRIMEWHKQSDANNLYDREILNPNAKLDLCIV